MIKTYYILTKPGIIMGNVITTVAGFALASKGHLNPWLFMQTILGLSLIMASACVFNNFIDRHVDGKMARTKNRALVTGAISIQNALTFAVFLGVIGSAILFKYTNLLTLGIALTGFVVYVLMYSIWKYRTTYGPLLGSVSGAVPPLVGYCAVSGQFDIGAFILFAIMVLWQMPHFYSIALYRFDDYLAAAIPILPIKKGPYITKIHMVAYIIAFILATVTLTLYGYAGYAYLTIGVLAGVAWLALCIKGFKTDNEHLWAKNMFRLSLVVVSILSVLISVDAIR